MNIPRPEYPRPQLVREKWINLNGEWDFEIDNAEVGRAKKFENRSCLDGKITVPFCPESRLSGVGNTDYMNCVWYRKDLDIPSDWSGSRILLNFGAVDYEALVFVNGEFCASHKGGYTSFSVDITDKLRGSGNYVTVCAVDHVRSYTQPVGKQSQAFYSEVCSYTRTTGIWQTVFMEPVGKFYIKNIRTVTDIDNCCADLTVSLNSYAVGCRVSAEASFEGRAVGSASVTVNSMSASLHIPLSEKHLWDVGQGNLYGLRLTVEYDGEVTDSVKSYFGLRSVALTDKKFMLNGKSVFGRWVLDQGFYTDGIYTAPTDEALKKDIEYSMQLGFNGARLHQKIFEPRYLYWADRLGYLVWGEHANWGLDFTDLLNIKNWLPEWMESVERDFSHPSVIGWCPFNETWDMFGRRPSDDIVSLTYSVTKAMDPTRPVIDTSGHMHVGDITDIYDIHDYEQDVAAFEEHYKPENGLYDPHPDRQCRAGQPFFVSEYGGIQWAMDDSGWGYGNAPKSEEEFIARYKGLTEALLRDPDCCAFCYTQLYDVEQEQNGLMTYDRRFKFDPEIFAAINRQKAAVEE